MNFEKYANEHREEMLKDLEGLLRINTVLVEQPEVSEAPFGENLVKALEYVLNLGKKMGFKVKDVDHVAGHIEFGEGDEVIGILAHLDVVPAGEGWTNPPFEPTLIQDKLYARGALDDKGAVISSLYAMKAIKDAGIVLHKKIRLILGTDEETSSRGIKRYLEVEKTPDFAFSPDADFPLIYGEKGILSFDLTAQYEENNILSFTSGDRYNVVPEKATVVLKEKSSLYESYIKEHHYRGEMNQNQIIMYGKRAHGMQPEKGENAALRLATFCNQIAHHPLLEFTEKYLMNDRGKDLGIDFYDPEMKELTMNVAVFDLKKEQGKIGINLRYPIHWNVKENLEKIKKLAQPYHIHLEVISDSKPHYVNPNDPEVHILHQAYIQYTQDTQTPMMTIGGGTYARSLAKAVAFGPMFPNREDVVHQVDEYILISDFLKSMAIYASAILELGK